MGLRWRRRTPGSTLHPTLPRLARALLFVGVGAVGLACADIASLANGQPGPEVHPAPAPPTPPNGAGTSPTPPTTGQSGTPRQTTARTGGEPARNNDVYSAVIDRTGKARDVRKVFAKGESPEGIRLDRDVGALKKGQILLYFMDFTNWSAGQDATTVVSTSADGATWSTPQAVRVDDPTLAAKSFVDVSVVQLADGRLRMYFMSRKEAYETTVPIHSAVSTDGVNFTVEPGVRVASTDNVEVARDGDTWVMFMSDYPKGTSGVATSADGLSWTTAGRVVPGVGIGAYEADGGLSYVAHGGPGLLGYGFDARAITATKAHDYAVNAGGGLADASPVVMPDGTMLVFFKRMDGAMKPAPQRGSGSRPERGTPPQQGAQPQRGSPQQHKERPPSAR